MKKKSLRFDPKTTDCKTEYRLIVFTGQARNWIKNMGIDEDILARNLKSLMRATGLALCFVHSHRDFLAVEFGVNPYRWIENQPDSSSKRMLDNR